MIGYFPFPGPNLFYEFYNLGIAAHDCERTKSFQDDKYLNVISES